MKLSFARTERLTRQFHPRKRRGVPKIIGGYHFSISLAITETEKGEFAEDITALYALTS